MSNSKLVYYTKLSPNHSGKRTHEIDRITPHCVVGQLSCESIAACFPKGRDASCNYGIGTDGRIALIVDEDNRSWCSSSNSNDQRAVTIECASDKTAPYTFNNTVYKTLIALCVDICERHNKDTLLWIPDKYNALSYEPKSNEMLLTVHRWFGSTACPGDWMYSRMGELAESVTSELKKKQPEKAEPKVLYRVQVGAYSVRLNADRQLAKVKAAGFSDAFVVKIDKYYKVQVGAYSVKANAERQLAKVKAVGFSAFITTVIQ